MWLLSVIHFSWKSLLYTKGLLNPPLEAVPISVGIVAYSPSMKDIVVKAVFSTIHPYCNGVFSLMLTYEEIAFTREFEQRHLFDPRIKVLMSQKLGWRIIHPLV